jgi:hypothetical protein
VIFYFATFFFLVCTILTLTSIREKPLPLSSSSRDNGDTENSSNDNDDDEHPEIEMDEKRSLLSSRRSRSQPYSSKTKLKRSTADIYFKNLNKREGFVEIDSATGGRIPHDYIDKQSEDTLLQNLEHTHQVVSASMPDTDSSYPTPVPTEAFDIELKQKGKLVKFGIPSFQIPLLHFLFFIIKVFCDVLHLKTIMMMTTIM